LDSIRLYSGPMTTLSAQVQDKLAVGRIAWRMPNTMLRATESAYLAEEADGNKR
jgi:hypothetical protein